MNSTAPRAEPLIYLDHAATTPVATEVFEAMLPFLSGPLSCGNPSSIHRFGRDARAAIDASRDSVAALIGADYSEIYFTSSGTEADNLALIGTMRAAEPSRNHLVTTAIEHHAILHTAHFLETQGFEVTVVPVESDGIVSLERLEAAVTERTALVSVMHANNEIGSLQPIGEIAGIAHARGAKFHTDAVQSAGVLPTDVSALQCDLLSLCAHKMYGPKGAGALYIRQGTKVSPLVYGGAQEREKRAGTENVAALVGLGRAAELAGALRETEAERLTRLRDLFLEKLKASVPGIQLNGHPTLRLPGNVNVSTEGVEGSTLLMNLDRKGVAASSGSACSSGSIEPSHVLRAIGLKEALASSGVRFSLGRETTEDELDRAAALFAEIVAKLQDR